MEATLAAPLSEALDRAARHAPFLRAQMERHADLAELLRAGDLAAALAACAAGLESAPVARRLRLERTRTALVLAIGDLAGALPLETVVEGLSDLADRSLDAAIAAAIEERTPGEPARGFAVIALGKHGGRELNYSSDIDPIFLYDPATLPHRGREEPAEAAVRIGRRVIELLQARDADGYAFRVDLRLRPSPEVTPIALPIDALISYYESSAVAWERAAFVRARAAAGDRALGQRFLDAIRPFVWRRSLDFGAVKEMRAMSHRIRAQHGREAFGPGYDLKRGRGGIREVEFFAQIHQLIHGGRDRALRSPTTIPALQSLAAAGIIDGGEARELADSYRLFRTIEHRLQMVDDRQTHELPRDMAALDNVAQLHGLAGFGALLDLLRPQVESVGRTYDALEDGEAPGLPVGAALAPALAEAGFDPPDAARAVIERWRGGGVRAVQSPAAREALEEVLPGLVEALGRAPDPQAALHRMDDIVGRLPSAINFFRLLAARPPLMRLLADLLSHAPTLAAALGRRPEFLDGLIDATAFDPAPPVAELAASFAAAEAGDYERLLDHVRRSVGERRFALGVQLVEGTSDPLEVAAGYARVAEAALDVLAAATAADYARQHGRVPDSELVILALGRLGGAALTHASDLDLIYLFTGTIDAASGGPKPLEATRYYNRLAQRVTGALSVPTAAGPLYEVDTRLRPSGSKGLLAVTIESFADYQRESAWTWEHMALTRARPVFGSDAARARVQAVIDAVLNRPRDTRQLLKDVVSMRSDMARHKPPAGPLDAKLIEGGLVDLEFCVHAVQLEHRTGFDPRLGPAIAALIGAGLLPADFAAAHDVLARMLVTLRLVAPDAQEPPPPARALVARACGFESWDALLDAYAAARQSVRDCWARIVARAEED
ncbi:bifunctional [glutamine synthetase] adenylyltransferase/[glutamine synthetase]-adenylyl-L-tyrosine phosphorylase [Sphingomonas changbaiensis]|nr:bifunctional [glutamine synthetase] adenylyltransferase/[glutamine synthetase]-adenylyl-L-tyrosine phosphorylase [Sphingomonas changbaiensis]